VTDDAALLGAAAGGDAAAFATFVRAPQEAARRHLRAFTGQDDVEDALQEAFFAAWRAAGSFRGSASARGWLFTIARNAVRHLQRRRVDEPATLESLEALAERGGWGAPAAAAEEDAATTARELVAAAFARLPAGEREVLSLRELDGLSGEETAALLGVSLPAMKSRLHRARLHLAAVVRELEPPMASHSGGTHAR
jgi:RNA polymerase sigma-70 factor (ECF subfamily)